MTRQVVLDTETTGLKPEDGHRVIEIGCVELVGGRPTGEIFHKYINPERDIDLEAVDVHGITNDFLDDKPVFRDIAKEFLIFIHDAELIIHNAPFDVGFLDAELERFSESYRINSVASAVTCTLAAARKKYPGSPASLDALCKRFNVDASGRTKHGALLDAELLADVYLGMRIGQAELGLDREQTQRVSDVGIDRTGIGELRVVQPSLEEAERHERFIDAIDKEAASAGGAIWRCPQLGR